MTDSIRVYRPSPVSIESMRIRLGWVAKYGFWVQVALGVTAVLSWIFVVFGQLVGRVYGLSAGGVFAFVATLLALIALGISLYFTFRFQKVSQLNAERFSPGEVIAQLQWVLYINLAGAFLGIVGSAAQVGELLSSTFFRQAPLAFQVPGQLLAVASVNLIFAHFISLTSALWIWGILDRKPRD